MDGRIAYEQCPNYKAGIMFSKSEKFYDEIYGTLGKDYAAEAERLHQFIQKHKRAHGNSLLDVACGTGAHAQPLSKHYTVEGLDVDAKMLTIAQRKYPALKFHHASMVDFDLGKPFEVITCLFSSIGYVRTKSALRKTLKNMSHHLVSGGVLLVEPWFTPTEWKPGFVHTIHVNKPELKITRMSFSGRKGNISSLEFHYLVGTPKGVEHFTEQHELGLFTHEDYIQAFQSAGLKTSHHKKGLDGRGLYIGVKP